MDEICCKVIENYYSVTSVSGNLMAQRSLLGLSVDLSMSSMSA